MNTLAQYILDSDTIQYITFPELSESKMSEIINEELNEPHLLALAQQLHDDKKAGRSAYNFAEIFYNGFRIKWDQIDASNVQEFDRIDNTAIQAARAVLTKNNGIVLITDPDWKYTHMYTDGPGGGKKRDIILSRDHAYSGMSAKTGTTLPATTAYYNMEHYGSHMVIISWKHEDLDTWDIKRQRSLAKDGMIPTVDYEEYCAKLAKENRARYRKIAESIKAKKNTNLNEMNELVEKAMDRMMKAMAVVQKDPAKWADDTYTLAYMMDRINGQKRYAGNEKGRRWSDPLYKGHEGILELFKQYNTAYVATSGQSGSSFNRSTSDNIKQLEDKIRAEYKYLVDNYFTKFGV